MMIPGYKDINKSFMFKDEEWVITEVLPYTSQVIAYKLENPGHVDFISFFNMIPIPEWKEKNEPPKLSSDQWSPKQHKCDCGGAYVSSNHHYDWCKSKKWSF